MAVWEDNIRKVIPYVPGEQPERENMIKLNTNENPYPPAPGVARVLKGMDMDSLRRYPDPAASGLVEAIAEYHGLERGQVFVGVGSDDVLAMAFLTCFNSGQPVLFPDITYSFYEVWADLFQIPYELQPLDENFKIRTEDYKKANGGIIFPNPNAPTGEMMSLRETEEIISCNQDVIVIVDEAYIDFGGDSCLPLLRKYDHLLIAQTFSKSRSLAGMRIGYLLGNEKLIRYINDCRYSFNSYTMNPVSIAAGVEALRDQEYFAGCIRMIVETREWAKEEFRRLGFEFTDSVSNFLFVSHPEYDATELFEALREEGIYVRHFNKPERIKNYLRVTIGTKGEMEQLFEFLNKYKKKF